MQINRWGRSPGERRGQGKKNKMKEERGKKEQTLTGVQLTVSVTNMSRPWYVTVLSFDNQPVTPATPQNLPYPQV